MPQNITLIHYIDDIMLIKLCEQEAADIQEALVSHMRSKGWKIHPKKIQKASFFFSSHTNSQHHT